MITALLVGLGGVAGALARFALDAAVATVEARRRRGASVPATSFPFGTMVVNTVGSLIIGFVWGSLQESRIEGVWYAVWATGLAGGLTTFSTLSVAAVALWQGKRPAAAVVHVGGNLMLGLAAAWVGVAMSNLL